MKSQSNSPKRTSKESLQVVDSQELDKLFEPFLKQCPTMGSSGGCQECHKLKEEAKAKLLELALSCRIEKPDMKMWKDIKNRKKFHRYAQDKAVTAAIDTMEQKIKERFS